MISPVQLEQIRLSLLRYALAPTRTGLLRANLRGEGWRFDDADIILELLYLQDKGFITAATKSVSPENPVWRTTAAGRDYLACQGETRE